ncbi:aflatoxin regulatory protein-domain-containing protein [Camillea tinctor]|nr:aflatoxin regulatory protein-domain-containing protein [Camillea tinctor]
MSSLSHGNVFSSESVSPVPVPASFAHPPRTKLKDSCDNCATAKLRCSKEKPTCSRCEKRGKKCQYFATKRAGRRRVSSLSERSSASSPGSMQIPLPQSASRPAETAPPLYFDPIPSLSPLVKPASTSINESSDFFSSWIPMPLTDVRIADSGGENLGIFSSYDDFLCPSLATTSEKLSGSIFSTTVNETYLDTPLCPTISSPSEHQSSTARDTELPNEEKSERSLSCISRATDILNQVCSHNSIEYTGTPNSGPFNRKVYNVLDTAGIIEGSRYVFGVIQDILECSCVRDGYLLFIIYLVVRKVLDKYTTAAQEISMSNSPQNHIRQGHHQQQAAYHPQQNLGLHQSREDNGTHGAESTHISTHLLLHELHRVRGLFNMLSQQLRSACGQSPSPQLAATDGSHGITHCGAASGREQSLNLPPAILAQAELDLRNNLSNLTARLMNMSKEH